MPLYCINFVVFYTIYVLSIKYFVSKIEVEKSRVKFRIILLYNTILKCNCKSRIIFFNGPIIALVQEREC